jgi:DNA polymerase III alpha subunit
MQSDSQPLLRPVQMGDLRLPNRIVMAPLTRQRAANPGHVPTKLLLYVESARGYHNLCRLLSRHAELAAARDDEASVAARQRLPFRRNEFDGLTDGLIAVSEDIGTGGNVSKPILRHGDGAKNVR